MRDWRERLGLWGQACTAQFGALAATALFAAWVFSSTPASAEAMWLPLAFVQGGCAAVIARWLRSPPWWIAIHLVFLPGIIALLRLNLPPWLYLAAFLLSLLLFWRTDLSRVPLFLSSPAVAEALAAQLAHGATLLDLGCGDGRLLAQLARLRRDCRLTGIEHAPLPWLIARWRCRRLPNVTIRYGDFWREPLSAYDVVYAFLSPAPMPTLWAKACAEMRPAALLISNSFAVPGIPPEAVISLADQRKSRLFLYRPAALDKTA